MRMTDHFDAFKAVVIADYPYEVGDAFNQSVVIDCFADTYSEVVRQHSKIQNNYFSRNGEGYINLAYLDHFLILCLRLSKALVSVDQSLADAIYYSCRVRTSTDVYYRIEIGDYFMPSHPIGAVVDSKATYGKGFRLYNGVHVGPHGIVGQHFSEWVHPVIGDGVIAFANSSIYGKTVIGNNVTISPGSTIINESIPDNCVVFGSTPELKVIPNKFNNLDIIST